MLSSDLVEVSTSDAAGLTSNLRHQLTVLCDSSGAELGGQTVWSTPAKSAVLCWKWTLTVDGIPVLADPRGIRSNLVFVEGSWTLPFERQLIAIGEVVNRLEWQQAVRAHLADLGVQKRKGPLTGPFSRSSCRPRSAIVATA